MIFMPALTLYVIDFVCFTYPNKNFFLAPRGSNTVKQIIVNNCGLRMCKLYRPFLPEEAAAIGNVSMQAVKENSD